MEIELKCCTCGTAKNVAVAQPPIFGIDFYKIVKDSGGYPVFDNWNARVLCFCDKDCMKKQLTKKGYLRKRLLHIPKEQGDG